MSQVFMSTLSNWAMYPVLMGPALDWGWSRSPGEPAFLAMEAASPPFPPPYLGPGNHSGWGV